MSSAQEPPECVARSRNTRISPSPLREVEQPMPAAVPPGVPNGIRTRVAAVKGRCPRPLDDRDSW
jgi:hypothetical protein